MSHHAAESKKPSLSLAERGFKNLVSTLADQEPRNGYSAVDQLPELTDLEVALVLRSRADLLENAVVGLSERVAGLLAHPSRLELIGADIVAALRKEARAHLLDCVQEECSKRELAQLGEAEDEARAQRTRRGDYRDDSAIAMNLAGVPEELRR